MGLAAGGRIKQSIVRDKSNAGTWDGSRTTTVQIHIVNSEAFKRITGETPPMTPITARTYKKAGLPYFDIYNEKLSGIKGDFETIKSVNQLDKEKLQTDEIKEAIQEVEKSEKYPVVELDPHGERVPFRHVQQLEQEMREKLRISDF